VPDFTKYLAVRSTFQWHLSLTSPASR